MPASNATLQYIGDACGPVLLALQSPTGPDAAARVTLSGTFAGLSLVFEKANTKAAYDADAWSPLASVMRQDTFNVLPNGVVTGLAGGTALDFIVPSLFALYAIRVRCTAITSGGAAVQCVTTSRSLTDPAQFMTKMALELTRIRVGISALTDIDLGAIDGSDSV